MNRTGLIVALFVATGAGLVLGLFPAIDLRIAQAFYAATDASQNVFALRLSSAVLILRKFRFWFEIVLIALPMIALIIKLFRPRTKMLISGNAIVFLLATLTLGPGLLVNVGLKNHWGRPRPGHIMQFGGDQHFVAWWNPRGECQKNCSFVSGEISTAFWTIAFAALAPLQWRALAYGAAFTFGIAISLIRMMTGGHFLSDAIFAGVLTFLIIWLMYALIYRWRSTRLDDNTIEDALERFSVYCRSVMRWLGHRSAD
jgi:membrane-associated PAP2 superfamily phosphatase